MQDEIKFQLVKDGEIVGYEKHSICSDSLSIFHSIDGINCWESIGIDSCWSYANERCQRTYSCWIKHDHKDQFSGIKDSEGNELYKNDVVEALLINEGKVESRIFGRLVCDKYHGACIEEHENKDLIPISVYDVVKKIGTVYSEEFKHLGE
jgi:hypothetical protein